MHHTSKLLGMLSFLVAHIIPVVNYIRYFRFKGKIVNSAKVELGVHGADTKNKEGKTTSAKETDKRLAFAKDKSFDQWEMNDNSKGALEKQKVTKAELTEKIAAMDSVMKVYGRLKAAAATTESNEAFDGNALSEPTPSKRDPSKLWRMTKDEKGRTDKPHLECGPTHE